MKNIKIKWLICMIVIGLSLSACGVQGPNHEGTKGEAAETIEVSSENSPEETGPDAESLGETGPDVESPEETEPRANSSEGQQDFDLEMVPAYSGEAYADINDDIPFFTEEELTAEPFEEYWPLDELGRCTGAFACIGPELLPTEVRGSQSAATPVGW